MSRRFLALFVASIWVVSGIIVPIFSVQAMSSSSNITVGATITSGGGGGEILPPVDNPPSIGSVVVTSTLTTAHITWSAADDLGISSVTFQYGTTASYGSSGTVSGTYLTDLSGLTENTTYYYKISVTDSGAHTTTATGSLTTLAAPDTTPPVVSGVVVTPNPSGAMVAWTTNEVTTGQVLFGLTNSYGLLVVSQTGDGLSHTATLTDLLASSTYHFQIIATDVALNSASTNDQTFETLRDIVPPANPNNVFLTTTTHSIVLSWTNPPESDFSGIKIVRKVGSAPTSIADGTTVYTGSTPTFIDNSVVGNVDYFYSLFAFDTSANYSSGVVVNGSTVLVTPPNEICGNGIDDNSNGLVDCADSACIAQSSCQPKVEICSNSIDDDSNGLVDCADPVCSGASFCATQPEICDNHVDDNLDGKTDCSDVACFGFPSCTAVMPPIGVPSGTVSSTLGIDNIIFLGVNRTVTLRPNGTIVTSLAGTTLAIGVRKTALASTPVSVTAIIDGDRNQMKLDAAGDTYFTDVVFPRMGSHNAALEVNYGQGEVAVVPFTLQGLPFGMVTGDGQSQSGVSLVLVDASGQTVSIFGNPFSSTVNGTFGWVVPNATYSIKASKKGFYDRTVPAISVQNNVINPNIDLIVAPPDLLDNISATSSLADNASAIAKNLGAKTKAIGELGLQTAKDAGAAVEKFKADPVVQDTASHVVAPTIVTATAIGTLALISWANLLPFLRLLFLQPLLLLGLQRRKGWGQVYNTLTKLPIDLATLRLFNAETGRVLQSKVTDKQGRYAFVVGIGKYKIQVVKDGFTFPSTLLAGATTDGRRTDIYHGEVIEVAEKDAVITVNIPLDPAGEHKIPMRIIWQKIGRVAQTTVSWVGLLVTVASLYISPRWYVWLLLGLHIFLFFAFRRLALVPKIKSWGIVSDDSNKKPIGRVVARLFNSEFNKLVATQITDGSGRYYFLAGDDKYYVTYDHPEYAAEKTQVIDLSGKEAANIATDIAMRKADKTTPAQPPAPPIPTPIPTALSAQSVTTMPVPPGPLAAVPPPVLLLPAPPESTPPIPHIDLSNPPEPGEPLQKPGNNLG